MEPNAARLVYGASVTAQNLSAAHNVSVDEGRRHAGVCAQLHLPTGRMCTLPHGHPDSCEFVAPDQVDASLARQQRVGD
ncbi:hypothetical protein [Pengzhenrongella frigida]|uniref:Uncharacterized protein n=1 Tax=Pengzhenrongella frigida TaxID=1259133 RepID=A0A4Q5N268_9MICO|nr:hypothetical protein [Cellulomonas sp. HLT2-17]RYV51303.1 hypothetical protein EUA98_09120 [Cellulomonas sp. HLT2-17]